MNALKFGIFAGIIASILGNFFVTSFFKIVEPNLTFDWIIFILSAILFIILYFIVFKINSN